MAASICPLPLASDQHTRIEDQSYAGDSSGSRWLSMAASTSLAKSASMTAVESSGSSAMHSEMVRRGGGGAWITATGSLPLFDHGLRAGAHARHAPGEVAGSFRLRDVDYMVSHGTIIPSFLFVRFGIELCTACVKIVNEFFATISST